jgi:5-methylcytosine-specific restriction endonuclease McrA
MNFVHVSEVIEEILSDTYPDWRYLRPTQKRHRRIMAAREKGRHSQAEWAALKRFYRSRCVRCGRTETPSPFSLNAVSIEKDHVYPIRFGGCDCIGNIQPLCSHCNASKGAADFTDYRSQRIKEWRLET